MTRAEELKAIRDAVIAGGYSDGEFKKFKDEYGWADWMSDYTEAEEDRMNRCPNPRLRLWTKFWKKDSEWHSRIINA